MKGYNLSNGKYPLTESTACLEDRQHRFWAIAKSGGLLKYDEQKDCFEPVGKQFGIEEDKLYAINKDAQGALWMSTDNYLIRLSFDQQGKAEVRRFYVFGDLPNVKLQKNATSWWNRVLYLAGMNGIVALAARRFLLFLLAIPIR